MTMGALSPLLGVLAAAVMVTACSGPGPAADGEPRPVSVPPPHAVGCDQVIARVGAPGGRVVLGVLAVPPAHLEDGAPTGTVPWAHFSKWEIFGSAWAWPQETMTLEEDRHDLPRHEEEIAAHPSFNYALLDEQETAILGCVYIDPPERAGSDAEISWWVVDDLAGGEAERALEALVPQWIAAHWPFLQPRYLGRDISWHDWLALPPPHDLILMT